MYLPKRIRLSTLILAVVFLSACNKNSGTSEVLAQIRPNTNASADALEVRVTRATNGNYIIAWQSNSEGMGAMVFANTQLTHKLSNSEVVAVDQSPPVTWTPTDASKRYYFSVLYQGQLVIVDGMTGEVVEPHYEVSD
ncbi:MAG: hypothetical protein AAGL69_14750 [Pseudomonadota bacterium]